MPRFILKKPPQPPEHDRLVRRLVQELRAPGDDVQPVILEQEIEATGSRHVHVIWDRWKGLADEQRSDIVWEAYTQAEGPTATEEITIATGATPGEAVVLGLLPFKVVATRNRQEARPPLAKYKKVLEAEARNTLLGPEAEELRYPRVEEAEEARKRLEKALPGSAWAVVQLVPYEA